LDSTYPAVAKPRYGAGSLNVRRVEAPLPAARLPEWTCLEEYCAGMPASVSLIRGREGRVAVLPPCRQTLSSDGRFTYLGGELPLAPAQQQRARRLALRVADVLPATTGYFGIDLVLDPDTGGQLDRVIEVNPRLTTSYVGLRAACRGNLAAAMLALAEGRDHELSFREEAVEFTV
jgi:predicted ATP-grasp superfamily ATP-dependent carboligase